MQSDVLIQKGVLMCVLPVPPLHGLFPIEIHQTESARCIEEHHHHKHGDLFVRTSLDVDTRQESQKDSLMVAILDIFRVHGVPCGIEGEKQKSINDGYKHEKDRDIAVEDDKQGGISARNYLQILVGNLLQNLNPLENALRTTILATHLEAIGTLNLCLSDRLNLSPLITV